MFIDDKRACRSLTFEPVCRCCGCCSHVHSSPQYNAVRGRRTGSNNSGVEENTLAKENKLIIVHMITEAPLHLREKIKSEVRARTYQIHAVRCTSRHRNREDHILPRKNRQDENNNSTSKNRKKITHPRGKREKKVLVTR